MTEDGEAGWSLTNLVCVDPDGGSSVVLATGVSTIHLDPGETVTCTYTNTKRDRRIIKDAVPNDAQDFAFTTSGLGLGLQPRRRRGRDARNTQRHSADRRAGVR